MPKSKLTIIERFFTHVSPEPNTGCWLWTAGEARGGYGKFKADGKTYVAHRFYWESIHGKVPAGLQLDHLCRVRSCVNPDHLEPVTALVNIQRGIGNGPAVEGLKKMHAAKTHCKNGHPYDGPGKHGQCRACCRDNTRNWRMRQLEKHVKPSFVVVVSGP